MTQGHQNVRSWSGIATHGAKRTESAPRRAAPPLPAHWLPPAGPWLPPVGALQGGFRSNYAAIDLRRPAAMVASCLRFFSSAA